MTILRILPVMGLLLLSWIVMTTSHELGHLVCGYACGGSLIDYDLVPWRLPYSHFSPDPYPRITLWGGLILGIFFPVIIAVLLRRDWCWFIAYFCVLSNGLYIAAGWISGESELDTNKLFKNGESWETILIYCTMTLAIGYFGFRRLFR